MIRRLGTALFLASGLVACGGAQKSAAPKAAASPEERATGGAPARAAAPPPMQPPQYPSATASRPTEPGAFAPAPSPAVAMAQASNEVETSQRELDVAGGDCHNACRALGSMDRAAGRLCSLAQSNEEVRRCGDARNRLYSARDKVRSTCGSCPDVSVDRSAPIPSR